MTNPLQQLSPPTASAVPSETRRPFRRSSRLLTILVIVAASLLGCRTQFAATPTVSIAPEPVAPAAAWQTASRGRARSMSPPHAKPVGHPALPGVPQATFLLPTPASPDLATPVFEASELPGSLLAPNALDWNSTAPNCDPQGLPGPPLLMPPVGSDPEPAAPVGSPDLAPLPSEPAPVATSPSTAEWSQLETRVASLESQLETSRDALRAMTAALQSAQAHLVRLESDLELQRREVVRLEGAMEEHHQADLERLERLSQALDQLISRESQTASSASEVLR